MSKYLIVAFVFAAVSLMAADANQPVPSDIGVRIRTVMLDQARKQTEIVQLNAQYQADQQVIQHDEQELNSLKQEALATAKLDPAKYDVDAEKLIFITKSEPAKK